MPFDTDNPFMRPSPYRGTVTLDPTKVRQALEKLGADPMADHLSLLPEVLHKALIEAMKDHKALVGKR